MTVKVSLLSKMTQSEAIKGQIFYMSESDKGIMGNSIMHISVCKTMHTTVCPGSSDSSEKIF